jgi:cellulose synthase/poly-beta-1,6-N-acetylglucosamine synthase-like glycosyltransferase
LPQLDVSTLADALRRLPEDELAIALRSKLVPIVTVAGLRLFAACGASAFRMAEENGLKVVADAAADDFHAAVRLSLGRRLAEDAANGLARVRPEFSASQRLTHGQMALSIVTGSLLGLGTALLPLAVTWFAASLSAALFFLSVIAVRMLCLLPPPQRHGQPRHVALADSALPIYTLLVPLHRETSVFGQLLEALMALDYPCDRLDIKLVIEESDIAMQRALAGTALPEHFDVIVVPCGLPQTKPRALNYALCFARGSLLTIYDAEDIPDPRQLRRAAAAFAALPQDTACLQAELVFDNADENWLTRQFTIEYAMLFGMILPALAAHRLPLPLGGTSNHFRIDALRRAGAWDAYNVTEDADLGIRLARLGFDTDTIASCTFEEANVNLGNWMRQRTRWMKGFLATWLVHMREPLAALHELGPSGFWSMQALTIGVFASALVHPPCLIASILLVTWDHGQTAPSTATGNLIAGLGLLVFVLGYAVSMIAAWRALRRYRIFGWWRDLMAMPAYWLLMSVAAWLALWQFIVAPFHWNKTVHGLSRKRGSVGFSALAKNNSRVAR